MIGAAFAFLTGGSAVRLLLTVLSGVAFGGWAGWQVQGWRADHNRAQQIEQAARDTLRQIERRDGASATYQQEQTHADKTHTQITERVRAVNARPAARVQCLTADGLRLLSEAIDNGAPAATTTGSGTGLRPPAAPG